MPELTEVEKAMLWERMSGERLSDAERQRILDGGKHTVLRGVSPMSECKERTFRQDWFKLLACRSHTWPVVGCEQCFYKLRDKLELVCATEWKQQQSVSND